MRSLLSAALVASLTVACQDRDQDPWGDTSTPDIPAAAMADPGATATVRDAAGRDLGTLTFTDAAGGILVSGRLTGLPPGEHAMHLHASGDCTPPGFESAGDHWNPTNRQHGTQNPMGPHLGDLSNISVGQDSVATVQAVTPDGSLRGTPHALLDADGAAVIIHAAPDDYQTNPSGGSGNPIACGVISGL